MDISALLGSGLLQSMSPTTEAKSLQSATQQLLSVTDSKTASAEPASDTYTPSGQNQEPSNSGFSSLGPTPYQYTMQLQAPSSDPDAGSLKITVSSYMPAVLPQAVTSAIANAVTPEQTAWGTLQQSLASGNASTAQSALSAYNQMLPSSNLYMSSATTPSAQFLSDLTAVGSALASGDLAGAQAAFQTAQGDHPESVAAAVSAARGNLLADTTDAVQTLADSSALSSVNYGQLSIDQTNLDSVSREQSANISDSLVAQGYSAADASKYANAFALPSDTISMSAVSENGTTVSIGSLTNYLTNVSIGSAAERTGAAGVSTGNGAAVDANASVNAIATINETTSAITDVNATIISATATGSMNYLNSSVIENATATTSIDAGVTESATTAGNGSGATTAANAAAVAGSETAGYAITGTFENFNPATFAVTGFSAETSTTTGFSADSSQNAAGAGSQTNSAGQTPATGSDSGNTHEHRHGRSEHASNTQWTKEDWGASLNAATAYGVLSTSQVPAASVPASAAEAVAPTGNLVASDPLASEPTYNFTTSNSVHGGWDTASVSSSYQTPAWLMNQLGGNSVYASENSSATVSVYA
jgi:hypothetical protein